MVIEQNPPVHSQMIPFLLKKALRDLKKTSFSLIDVGCGSGETLYCLKKDNYLHQAQIFGLDIDKKALQRFKEKIPEGKVILADALNLKKIKNNSFDLAICNQVVEHVENDKALVSEINRILKKKGQLYITSVLKKWYGLYWYRNKFGQIAIHPDHLREYSSPQEFRDLLTRTGFTIKDLKIYSSSFPLGDYLLRLLKKVGLLRFTTLRDYYLNHPGIFQLASRMLFPPIPGYATIEALAEKK